MSVYRVNDPERHAAEPGRDRDDRADQRDAPADQHGKHGATVEPALCPLDVLRRHLQPLPVAHEETGHAVAPDPRREAVEDPRPDQRADRGGDDHPDQRPAAPVAGDEAGERQHDLRRDRREQVLQRDEQRDADVAEGVDDVDDPVGQRRQHQLFLTRLDGAARISRRWTASSPRRSPSPAAGAAPMTARGPASCATSRRSQR